MDWLVVDHYALAEPWELALRTTAARIMVIDDLANRRHECDVLLDQNLVWALDTRYDGLVPSNCRRFLGPRHALLRREFIEARGKLPVRDGRVRRVFVFLGGADASQETEKTITAIRQAALPELTIDVVVGAANPRRDAIQRLCAELPGARFHYQVDNMAELMAKADLAIGAAGAATWERCYLGLPTIMLVVAANQLEVSAAVEAVGAAVNLGRSGAVSVERVTSSLRELVAHPLTVARMSERALEVMGKGAEADQPSLVDTLLEMRAGCREHHCS